MLDFFKVVYDEINGFDHEEIKKIKKQNNEEKKLFSKSSKVIIYSMGLMYLLIAGLSISVNLRSGFYMNVVKYIVLIIIDIVVMVLMLINEKKTQLMAGVGIVIFMIISFASTLFR